MQFVMTSIGNRYNQRFTVSESVLVRSGALDFGVEWGIRVYGPLSYLRHRHHHHEWMEQRSRSCVPFQREYIGSGELKQWISNFNEENFIYLQVGEESGRHIASRLNFTYFFFPWFNSKNFAIYLPVSKNIKINRFLWCKSVRKASFSVTLNIKYNWVKTLWK